MISVILKRQRIGDAAAGEGQPGLTHEKRNIFRCAKAERMVAALKQARI